MSILSGNSQLKSGYSTGTCAAAALSAALQLYKTGKSTPEQTVVLPGQESGEPKEVMNTATLHIEQACIKYTDTTPVACASVRKPGNDDADVTKNVLITVEISEDIEAFTGSMNPEKHTPIKIHSRVFIYAGSGTGVATLRGLKVPPGYPAINPGPLEMFKRITGSYNFDKNLYILVSVENGEEVARQTANEKVGVLGGISILGSRGIVKPLSNEAYLESVAAEISVALELHNTLCFALGNSSVTAALDNGICSKENLIETGNFVKDSLLLLKGRHITRLTFVAGTGKMARVALGYGNTHSHRGPASPADISVFSGVMASREDLERFSTFRGMEEDISIHSNHSKIKILESIAAQALKMFHTWIDEWNQTVTLSDTIQIDSICMILLASAGTLHQKCNEPDTIDAKNTKSMPATDAKENMKS